MHIASDWMWCSMNMTPWFRTCPNIMLYALRARHVLCNANSTRLVCTEHLKSVQWICKSEDIFIPYLKYYPPIKSLKHKQIENCLFAL